MKEYVIYKGEEIIAIGTTEEIAKKLNVLPDTIRFYNTDSYKKRVQKRKNSKNARVVISLD